MSTSGSREQFRQLPMFMTAREITGSYQHWDRDAEAANPMFGSRKTGAQVREQKVRETESLHDWDTGTHPPVRTWAQSIASGDALDSASHPVWLETGGVGSEGKPQIINGQHRVYTMAKYRPDQLMPVEHALAPKPKKRRR